MAPYVGTSITIPPIFVFEASNVPWKMETEGTGTVKCTVENTLLSHI